MEMYFFCQIPDKATSKRTTLVRFVGNVYLEKK